MSEFLEALEVALKTRKCAARGCPKPSHPNGFFCSAACRARTWKDNHPGYDPRAGRENAVERRRGHAGGLQVSFWKAVRELQGPPGFLTEQSAVAALVRALPEAQRARFLEQTKQRFLAAQQLPGQLNLEDEA